MPVLFAVREMADTMFRLGIVQMDLDWADPEKNIARAEAMVQEAASAGCTVVVLPELWSTALCGEAMLCLARRYSVVARDTMCSWAKQHDMLLVGGSIGSLKSKDLVLNTCYVIDRSGRVIGQYSKVHLFPLLNEHLYLTPGSSMGTVTTDVGVLGIMICYDIRFPEIARMLALQGAGMLFVPANFPDPRLDVWRTLLRARAIENQVFVIGANRTGSDPDHSYFGHSMVVDPQGMILIEGNRTESLLMADIDLDHVKDARSAVPAFSERRPDIYSLNGL